MSDVKQDVNQAACLVLLETMKASNEGTFSVGGILIENETGKVIHQMHNKVVQRLSSGRLFTQDPTAHGERQIVSWYYQNKDKLPLKAPEHYTVLTSLDPCVMCTGALLAAGFNVGVIAIDDFAGINYDLSFKFPSLPTNLQQKAQDTFVYYAAGKAGVDPQKYVRTQQGNDKINFTNKVLSSLNLMSSGAIFQESVNQVREKINVGQSVEQLTNPASLPEDSPIKTKFRSIYNNAFKIKVDDTRLPDNQIRQELENTVMGEGGNAVAFLDYFGNLVLCLADNQESPIQTAFMEVTQKYAKTRWELMNDAKPEVRLQAENTLCNPKDGTFVFLYAPNPDDALTIMTLGAYGSTMEGPIPRTFPLNFQFYNPPKVGTVEELILTMTKLPPLYTKVVQIGAMEVYLET